MLLHGELALGQRAVENLTGVVPVAVLRPGSRRLPLCHVDDGKSSADIAADQMAIPEVWRRSHASAVGRPTYSGHRATAATGGGLWASAPVPAGRGVLRPTRCHGGLPPQPVPAAGREVPWQAQYGDVSDLPQGTAHLGVL